MPGGWDNLHLEKLFFDGDFPVLNCTEIPIDIRIANIHDTSQIKRGCTISTFVNDYLLERFWSNPWRYMDKFRESSAIMSPDFSLLIDMPKPLQIFNVYRNRFVGFEWQRLGLNVIPTIAWSDTDSFDYCFSGIQEGSVVAVSNIGCKTKEQKKYFDKGYSEMIDRIQPKSIIFMANNQYKSFYESDNVIFIQSHFERKRNLWEADQVKA